jgi:glycosyltransferase involved in cell wall biosynthesis
LSVHVRVHVVDPSAYTPPYDHALCRSLAAAGAEVELYTSRFLPAATPAPDGYVRHEAFYVASRRVRPASARRALKLAEHVPDMLRYRRSARTADVVHFQWLTVQHIDGHLLPARRTGAGARVPLVLTSHDILPREPRPGQRAAQRRLYRRFDAIVVHTAHGRERLVGELGVDAQRVHVIPHGVLTHLAEGAAAPPAFETELPVVLFFGLLRPYKGLDLLLEAWRGIEGAELWVVGGARMDISALRAAAPANVRFDPRFIDDQHLRGYFRRADLVVLPYREIDQSGVLFTALAFGKPLLVSDVGGFAELAASGAARAFPAGDARALHEALQALLCDPAERAAIAGRAREVALERYSWDRIAARTLELYGALLGHNDAR